MTTHYFDNTQFCFSKILLEHYNDTYLVNIDSLENLHNVLSLFSPEEKEELIKVKLFGVNDRNSMFIKDFYNLVDNSTHFMDTYRDFIKQLKEIHFPHEKHILYQATPNLRISFPGSAAIGARPHCDPSGVIGLHTDGEFGHLDEEINVIIPLTAMYGTNSVYYEPEEQSGLNYDDYSIVTLEHNEYFMGGLNKWKHYNRINATQQTRVSLDVRIIPFSQYKETNIYSVSSRKKFIVGDYYNIM